MGSNDKRLLNSATSLHPRQASWSKYNNFYSPHHITVVLWPYHKCASTVGQCVNLVLLLLVIGSAMAKRQV